MAAISLISIVRKNIKLLNPTKVWVSGFLSVNRNRVSALAIMKKLKNGCHFININRTEKFQITDPPKVWVSGFPSVNGNGISVLAIMKKLKNGCHFVNIDCTEKFQITDPAKVWVSGFPSVNGNGIPFENWRCKFSFFPEFSFGSFFPEFSFGSFFPITHHRFHFNICVATLKTFMRGHLCISGLSHESPMCSFTLPDIVKHLKTDKVE